MTILNRDDIRFSYLHLTGAAWQEPVRDSLESRLAALAEHGVPAMGMSSEELEKFIAEHSADKLHGLMSEYGVRLYELEVLFGWNAGPEESGGAREAEARFLDLAEAAGVPTVKTCAVYPPGVDMPPVEVLAERFGALCDRAAARNFTVALEAMAVMPGFTYQVAADVVAAADRPNAGLVIDMWHLFRDPAGVAAIDGLKGSQIVGVEFGDAPLVPDEDVMHEVLSARLLPGEGECDITGLLRTLDAKGVDVAPSVEVLSTELRALTPSENIARTLTAVRRSLETARAA
ncbi:sugar phosphate isomerase/epimerase family protein [Streptomyces sp. DT171]|uniref:sugar phosphate isomerase/epimerase family protein n=1 Tax=Streptomyces sp. DT171 TaxID=3416524 RepID=UPI003CF70C7C